MTSKINIDISKNVTTITNTTVTIAKKRAVPKMVYWINDDVHMQ